MAWEEHQQELKCKQKQKIKLVKLEWNKTQGTGFQTWQHWNHESAQEIREQAKYGEEFRNRIQEELQKLK